MQIVAYSAGTNSKALIIEMRRRGEPIDLITMADPGREWPHSYFDAWDFNGWIMAQGLPSIVIVRPPISLEDNCLKHAMLPSIVYGYKSCSDKAKIRPQNKYVASLPAAQALWAAGEKITKCMGYHADEPHRATIEEDSRYRYRYPLIEWRMGQEDCVNTIARAGLPQPGKSACTFCPSSPIRDIFKLRDQHPDLLARALAMEARAMPNLRTVRGLGRHWSWKELLDADEAQGKLFANPPAMPCVCIDGDDDDD